MNRTLQTVEEELVGLLQKNGDRFLNSKDISLKLGVHPYAVYQAVRELRRWEFQIQSERGKGYKLVESPDLILAAKIKKNLKTKIFGKKIYSYRKVGSTNMLGFRWLRQKQRRGPSSWLRNRPKEIGRASCRERV